MNRRIRVLIWDDEMEEVRALRYSVEQGLDGLGIGEENIDIEEYNDVSAAIDAAARGVFQLVVTDIMRGEDHLAGLTLIKAAARAGTPVIAVSAGDIDLGTAASKAGARAVVGKTTAKKCEAGFVDALRGALEAADVATHGTPLEVARGSHDLITAALFEEVGDAALSDLIGRAVPDAAGRARLCALDGGKSGAYTIRVTSSRAGGRMPVSVLVKMSRSVGAIKAERDKAIDMSDFAANLWANLSTAEVVSGAEWHAIAYRFQEGATTLEEWVRQASRSEVGDLLGNLFSEDRLSGTYQGTRVGDPGAAFHVAIVEGFVGLSRRALWESTVRRSEGWQGLHGDSRAGNLACVRNLINTGVVSPQRANVRDAWTCECHGDLHSRNILVTRDRRPLLVDPALRARYPWPSDVARLLADLACPCWGSVGEDYDWQLVSGWIDACIALLDRIQGQATKENAGEGPGAACEWLCDNYRRIYGTVDDDAVGRELCLSIAVEWLRGASRVYTPAPRAVACLAAAESAFGRYAEGTAVA
jgi:hypothetical protein